MNYKTWEDIPMFTVALMEANHESQQGTRYHWIFKDHVDWCDCTSIDAFSMTPTEAKPFLDHVPIWKYPGPIKSSK